MDTKVAEKVFCVPDSSLSSFRFKFSPFLWKLRLDRGPFVSWDEDPPAYFSRLKSAIIGGRFINRPLAEEDVTLRQIIPYVALVSREGGEFRVFRYLREFGGEDRLRRLYSIGVGGHINLRDEKSGADGKWNSVLAACCREILEETPLIHPYSSVEFLSKSLVPLGLIRISDSNSSGAKVVDRVHAGVCFSLVLPSEDVLDRESLSEETKGGQFVSIDSLSSDGLEEWSVILLNCLKRLFSNGV